MIPEGFNIPSETLIENHLKVGVFCWIRQAKDLLIRRQTQTNLLALERSSENRYQERL